MRRYQRFGQRHRLALIEGLRAGGMTWADIADILEYGCPQQAADARRRLTVALEKKATKELAFEVVKKRVEKHGIRPTARALGYKSPRYIRRWLKQEAAEQAVDICQPDSSRLPDDDLLD